MSDPTDQQQTRQPSEAAKQVSQRIFMQGLDREGDPDERAELVQQAIDSEVSRRTEGLLKWAEEVVSECYADNGRPNMKDVDALYREIQNHRSAP